MEREKLLERIDAVREGIRPGQLHAAMIEMTREERDTIQRLIDEHYSELC